MKRPFSWTSDVRRGTAPRLDHRWLVVALVALTMIFNPAWTSPASASSPSIFGVVKDSGDVEQPDVKVEVLRAGSSTVVAQTTTGEGGKFSIDLPSDIYDLRFTPPADSGLRSYLATGVSPDSGTALIVVLKSMHVSGVQGTVRDSKGNPLPYFTVSLTPTESGRSTSVT
ncbi:hypothetical protein ABZ754_18745, partial [Micromonospora purpureochromogenes]|uniref:hypothetical protein n=1 Tax=Micromonospora purpureochromogenes TaxID=47872 RepID=UPI0033FE88AB